MIRDFNDIIEDIMVKVASEDTINIDLADINPIDRNTIMDTLEDFGYKVNLSYGSDELVAVK